MHHSPQTRLGYPFANLRDVLTGAHIALMGVGHVCQLIDDFMPEPQASFHKVRLAVTAAKTLETPNSTPRWLRMSQPEREAYRLANIVKALESWHEPDLACIIRSCPGGITVLGGMQ